MRFLLNVSPVVLIVVGAMVTAHAAAAEIQAGFAETDLTPPLGVELAGFGVNLQRTAEGIRDRLHARAAVFEQSGKRAAIVACDLGGIRLVTTEEIRRRVQAATGIPPEAVLISTSHTHSAPATAGWQGLGQPDAGYIEELPRKVAQAVIDAARNLQPVAISYGEAPVSNVARNREYPNGPVDKNVRVLKFALETGRLVGFIANYSVHPVVMSEQTRLVTGDLTGVATSLVMEKQPGAMGIFLQGACGDINPTYAHMPQDESLERLGLLAHLLAASISQALSNSQPVSAMKLAIAKGTVDLPLAPPAKAFVVERLQSALRWLQQPDLPIALQRDFAYRRDTALTILDQFNRQPLDKRPTEVQAAVIGDAVIVANPAELFHVFAEQTTQALGGHVMVAGYCNDYAGYVPAKDRFAIEPEKPLSYPAYQTFWFTGTFPYREDAGEVLVKAMVDLAVRTREDVHSN